MDTNNKDSSNLKYALLQCTSKLKALPEEKLQALLDIFHRQIFNKDVMLVTQGDQWNKVFFVERGIVRLFFNTPDGREFNKNFFYRREIYLASDTCNTSSSKPFLYCHAGNEPYLGG